MNVWMTRRCSPSSSPAFQAFAVAGNSGGDRLAGQRGARRQLGGVADAAAGLAGLIRMTSAITLADAPPSAGCSAALDRAHQIQRAGRGLTPDGLQPVQRL